MNDDTGTPRILDKLQPCEDMARRRMKLDFLAAAKRGREPFAIDDCVDRQEERSMFMDALEYVEIYSEDAWARIMARAALGRRKR
jgi:hypothetical protein